MFKHFYNSALLTATLEPDGPLLIVKGGYVADPTAPDLSFVRTRHKGASTIFLPGSSLKGVLRAHVERLLVTAAGEHAAESPFDHNAARRGQAAEARGARTRDDRRGEIGAPVERSTAAVYRLSCEAHRMFGSTEVAGRMRVDDAFPAAGSVSTDVRYGVAIDRAKQSVRLGPFESEAVVSGRFGFRAGLENYELWMLALLVQALDDVHAGLVQVGHSKSRGFGTVRIESPSLRVRQVSSVARLCGAGGLEAEPAQREAYGLQADDSIELPAGAAQAGAGLLVERSWSGWDALRGLRDAILAARWPAFVKGAQAAKPAAAPTGGARRG